MNHDPGFHLSCDQYLSLRLDAGSTDTTTWPCTGSNSHRLHGSGHADASRRDAPDRYRDSSLQRPAAIRDRGDWLVPCWAVYWCPPTSSAASRCVGRPHARQDVQERRCCSPPKRGSCLDSIDTSTLPGLRDRVAAGRNGLQLCARLRCHRDARGGLLSIQGKRWWLNGSRKKAGSTTTCRSMTRRRPISAPISPQPGSRPTKTRPCGARCTRAGGLSTRRMSRVDAFRMIQAAREGRRARRSQLPHLPGHRHHGVSAQWRHARSALQRIAAHESPSHGTKLYDRTADEVTIEDIENDREFEAG